MTNNNYLETYLKVSNEYNRTELSTMYGWHHKPNAYEYDQLIIIGEKINNFSVILDIGTGMGIAPRFFKELGARVITFDSFEASGSLAIDNIEDADIECHFVDVLSESFPIGDNTIDFVLFSDVIEHLHHSPKNCLNEINRVLKESGKLIISTPNAIRLTSRIKMLLGISNWNNIYDYFEKDGNFGHIHEYTCDEIKFILGKTNFKIVSLKFVESRLLLYKSLRLKHLYGNVFILIAKFILLLLPQLKSSMVITAEAKK